MRRITLTLLLGIAATLCLPPMGAHAEPSAKKGFDTTIHADGVWRAKVVALHAHWLYSWGPTEPKDMPAGVEYVPMAWGYYGNKDNVFGKRITHAAAQPNIHALLGFNEPDGKQQANLSVARALEGWPTLMQTNLTLGSPAAVHADGPWMRDFMAGVDRLHYRVDFIAIHWYGGADPKAFLAHLARVHALYHRPLWITEFAPADWSRKQRITPAQSAAFMRVVLPAMDKLDYVQRYAWFSAKAGGGALGMSALFNNDGTLTPLGQIYADH